MDDRAANGHLDLGAAAREAVGALAADLDRRVRRDRQLDLAAQAWERRLEVVATRRLARLELPFGIARRAHGRQVDLGEVPLVETDEPARELRRPPKQDEEEPGGERVERAGVAGAGSGAVAQVAHDREGGRAGRLVDEHEPGRAEPARNHATPAASPRRTRAARSR